MSIPTIKASARYYRITLGTASLVGYPFLELGPAGTTQNVSTMMVQFNPSDTWSGSIIPMGRILGTAANDVDTPFEPIPYKVGNLAGVAQVSSAGLTWPGAIAPITTQALIQIPASGLSIALLIEVLAGYMDVTSWDLQGSSAV